MTSKFILSNFSHNSGILSCVPHSWQCWSLQTLQGKFNSQHFHKITPLLYLFAYQNTYSVTQELNFNGAQIWIDFLCVSKRQWEVCGRTQGERESVDITISFHSSRLYSLSPHEKKNGGPDLKQDSPDNPNMAASRSLKEEFKNEIMSVRWARKAEACIIVQNVGQNSKSSWFCQRDFLKNVIHIMLPSCSKSISEPL